MNRVYHFQKFAVTDLEKEKIKSFYEQGFMRGDGKLSAFCLSIRRHKATVVNEARKLGLSSMRRKCTENHKINIGKERKEWFAKNGHPRGMLGKKHSPEYCEVLRKRHSEWHKLASPEKKLAKIKKSFSTRLAKYGTLSPFLPGRPITWKQGWREVGSSKYYFRSRWEANYGRYLEFLKQRGDIKEWLHEPQTFWFPTIKRGTLTYLPDFKVIKNDDTECWVEVKGWYDARSITKIKRFRKYFPEKELMLIDKKWFGANAKKMAIIIKDWEFDRK